MQLLAIRTKPDERVVDIHSIITPLWLWASVLKGKILEQFMPHEVKSTMLLTIVNREENHYSVLLSVSND